MIGVTLLALVMTMYLFLVKIKNGPSEAARDLFITTIMETGQLKFVANIICTPEEIDRIVNANGMKDIDSDVDKSMIVIGESAKEQEPSQEAEAQQKPAEFFDANGIRVDEISGRTFMAKMMVIKDPSKVVVGSTYPWTEYGKELDKVVAEAGGIAGVNGGLYQSVKNTGGYPLGVVVQNGEITYNSPSGMNGLYMIGLNENNILIIKNLEGMSADDFTNYVATEKIRDAVAFQDEASDADNHFVSLIINGESRQLQGQGSGANPRTAIGQRADGAILLLVTDGRGTSGHLGATASDLIGIMQEYGAVNAANLDGGSSSSMVCNGEYLMSSVTFYYQNSSWRLPTAFVVKSAQGGEQ